MKLRAASTLPVALGIAILIIGGAAIYFIMNRDTDTSTTERTENTPAPQATVTATASITTSATATPSATPTTSATPSASATTVSYTNSGFSPKNISVTNGTTVTFINNSTRDMWVGSDPHPIHTDYSAFDSKRSIEPGESWSFTFTKTGDWGYHNHDRDSDTGSVTVK